MSDLMKVILDGLMKNSAELKLFLESHFDIVEEESIIPEHKADSIEFKKRTLLKSKTLTEDDKLLYYAKDFDLYLEKCKDEKPESTSSECENMGCGV